MKSFLLILLLAVFVATIRAEQLTTFEEALHSTFPESDSTQTHVIHLSPDQVSTIQDKANLPKPPLSQYQIIVVQNQNKTIGYTFEDTVAGKWGPIHYFLGLDAFGKILAVKVLAYQERRGRPVAEKRFTQQFVGKDQNNPVRLRKDIQGITGATISSRGLTDGVRKLLYIFEEYQKL